MTVALVLGPHPEAIELASLAALLIPNALIIHSGPHYTATGVACLRSDSGPVD
ncbi:hypothetical protein ACOQFL_09965 [Actinopolyspora sp. H202]|uniref:hypothetical protein n=1 Tax=Actinopolyspora sp. H202 TaxID=1500456 RepID=UPI003EE659A7